MTSPARGPLILAAALLLPGSARAQAVTARVLAAEGAQPVVGAVVYLVDDVDTPVRRALTDPRGRALLVGFPAGRYRLRAEMIGMATAETEPFEVAGGAAVQRELVLESQAIGIEGLQVEADNRCRLRPEEGLLTARVWEEARKALEAATVTDEQRLYRYETMLYERDLDMNTRVVEEEERSRRRATMRTPFLSRPAEELMEGGFAERSGDGDVYYFAPDAQVLLSDVFLDSHCFRLTAGEAQGESAGLVGLAFEPTERRRTVDISGTLWLDPQTSELRWLEYRYENLDADIRSDELGGRVEFRRMPEGGWIIPEWWLRMPNIAAQRNRATGVLTRYLVGFRESGGLVLDVEGATAMGPARTGSVEGVVRDSLGRAVEGVRVEVVGAGLEAASDSVGHYQIDGLVAGTYRVRFTDPRLQTYGFDPEPLTLDARGGEVSRLDLRLPSAANVLADVCSRYDPGPDADKLPIQAIGTGVLVGWVRDAETDEPIPGALVRVLSYRHEFARGTHARGSLPIYGANVGELPDHETRLTIYRGRYGFETTADDEGFYRVCRVPERELLTVMAVHDSIETPVDTLKIMEIGGARQHVLRVERTRR